MLTQEYVNELFTVCGGDLLWVKPKAIRIKPMTKAGTLGKDGYIRVFVDGKSYLAHRIVYLMHHDEYVGELDHINRNKTDNSIENLRCVPRSENARNKGAYKNNSTGFKYVHSHPCGKYEAGVRVNGKRIYIGLFETPEEASLAAQAARATAIKAEFDAYKLTHP